MADCLAYFITFRTHGTWLHGDSRGSVHWASAGPEFDPNANPAIESLSRSRMATPAVILSATQREVVGRAITETCAIRGWDLPAQNVRTNHVHLVARAPSDRPERVMNALKSYATRYLREAACRPEGSVWARHGSTRYLWDKRGVEAACWYVVFGQNKGEA
jgi:REP element-mobilizing transposase RayT